VDGRIQQSFSNPEIGFRIEIAASVSPLVVMLKQSFRSVFHSADVV
jgi:hypothetical protein